MIEDEDVLKKRKDIQDAKDLRQSKKDQRLRILLGTKEFQQYCWDFWGETGTFQGNPYIPDSDQTVFNCGVRSNGLKLLQDVMRLEPSIFAKIQRDALSDPNRG